MHLAPLFFLACSTTPETAPEGIPEPPDTSAWADQLPSPEARQCFDAACSEVDMSDVQACFEAQCPERAEAIALVPQKVRWDAEEQLFFLEAHVDYTPAGWGSVDITRQEPLFVGVTLITPDGEELDLAIATRFPGAFDEPFFISSEVDKPVQDLIVGVWDRKIEPCDSERPGCKEFGFLLDGPLASWPPEFYGRFEAQRMPPAQITVSALSAGARTDALAQATATAIEALTPVLAPFGTEVVAGPPGLVLGPAEASLVSCQHPHDKPAARIIAQALGGEDAGWTCCEHTPSQTTDSIQLIVAGEPQHQACLREHCADASDLAACETLSCP